MTENCESTIERLKTDGQDELARQFASERSGLKRLIQHRVGARLHRRLDVSDIVQDVYVQASRTLSGFLKRPMASGRDWLRALTWQRLKQVLRENFTATRRSLNREIESNASEPDCPVLNYADAEKSAASQSLQAEANEQVRQALESLSDSDREIIGLRVMDGIPNLEAARRLGIEPAAATKRYVRALERLNSGLTKL